MFWYKSANTVLAEQEIGASFCIAGYLIGMRSGSKLEVKI